MHSILRSDVGAPILLSNRCMAIADGLFLHGSDDSKNRICVFVSMAEEDDATKNGRDWELDGDDDCGCGGSSFSVLASIVEVMACSDRS
jgi:hypothetical protein